jgi:hypothetical protein
MHTSSRVYRRPVPLLLAIGLALSALAAPGVAAAEPDQLAAPAAPAAPFRLNFYQPGDFVSQTNLVQCVGASMQMMLNMMRPENDTTAEYQLKLQQLARKWSPRRFPGTEPSQPQRPRRGASSRGWATGLNLLGYGNYIVTSERTLEEAVHRAALGMRQTGQPAGLLVWQGAHAWVLNGFEATGDLLTDPTARVTHVFVLDPLYPRTSSVWGPSPEPNGKLSLQALAGDFVPWRPGRPSPNSGRFVIVLPLMQPSMKGHAIHEAA